MFVQCFVTYQPNNFRDDSKRRLTADGGAGTNARTDRANNVAKTAGRDQSAEVMEARKQVS